MIQPQRIAATSAGIYCCPVAAALSQHPRKGYLAAVPLAARGLSIHGHLSRQAAANSLPAHRLSQHRGHVCHELSGRRNLKGLLTPCRSAAILGDIHLEQPGVHLEQVSVVYKFGGSSVATAERMLEVADIVCSFPEHAPLVVLSAMGKVRMIWKH